MPAPGRWMARVGAVGVVGGALFSISLAGAPAAAALVNGAPVASAFSCTGTPIVDVVARIKNEGDAGVSGKIWALIDIEEHAKIWQESPTLFCVLETDIGSFHSFAGTSPGGTGTISAHRHGVTLGVQRFKLNGTLHPVAPVSGFLGTFNFKCDRLGQCPGNVRFSQFYFTNITGVTGSSFAELDISNGLRHGIWFQSGTTSLGDITG
jgi:hypothetical protein